MRVMQENGGQARGTRLRSVRLEDATWVTDDPPARTRQRSFGVLASWVRPPLPSRTTRASRAACSRRCRRASGGRVRAGWSPSRASSSARRRSTRRCTPSTRSTPATAPTAASWPTRTSSRALAALTVCLVVLGEDRVTATALLGLPLIVLASKLHGLYDRDELVAPQVDARRGARSSSSSPRVYTLVHLAARRRVLIDGVLGSSRCSCLWCSLFGSRGRAAGCVARRVAGAIAPDERCLFIGDARSYARAARQARAAKRRRAGRPHVAAARSPAAATRTRVDAASCRSSSRGPTPTA